MVKRKSLGPYCRPSHVPSCGSVMPSVAKSWATVFSCCIDSPSWRCGSGEPAPGSMLGDGACPPAVACHDSSALVPGVPEVRGGHLQQVRIRKKKGLGLWDHDGGHLTRGGRGTPGQADGVHEARAGRLPYPPEPKILRHPRHNLVDRCGLPEDFARTCSQLGEWDVGY